MASGCIVSRSNVVLLVFDFNRAFSATPFRGFGHECRNVLIRRMRHCRQLSARHATTTLTSSGHASLTTDASSKPNNRLVVEYKKGLPQVCIPLPTTRQECLFTLRPISNTVGDFLNMIQTEDKAVSTVSISTLDDIRIASSNTIESLMEDDFKLIVNEKVFYVKIPEKEKEAKEKELERLSDIKALVNQLYVALNVEEHVVRKEREILEHLEQLKTELEPLEKKKEQLDAVAVRRTTALTWIGLGLMSVQFGILARLTWWEYSWDIMEPVTYFVTYGTAMAAYAYFVLTKQEYLLPDVRDRQHLITIHKRASKIGLDLNQYNRLKESIAQLESDLSRLRDPINPYVPSVGSVSHQRVHIAKQSSPLERTKDNIRSLFNSLRKK